MIKIFMPGKTQMFWGGKKGSREIEAHYLGKKAITMVENGNTWDIQYFHEEKNTEYDELIIGCYEKMHQLQND